MYVDSVYVKHFQEVAQLISPKTTAPMSGCLSFYYQLKQESSIVFTIYLRDTNGFYEEIWKTDSALSAGWELAEVDFSAPYPMEVKQSFLSSPATNYRFHQTSLLTQAKLGTFQWPSSIWKMLIMMLLICLFLCCFLCPLYKCQGKITFHAALCFSVKMKSGGELLEATVMGGCRVLLTWNLFVHSN